MLNTVIEKGTPFSTHRAVNNSTTERASHSTPRSPSIYTFVDQPGSRVLCQMVGCRTRCRFAMSYVPHRMRQKRHRITLRIIDERLTRVESVLRGSKIASRQNQTHRQPHPTTSHRCSDIGPRPKPYIDPKTTSSGCLGNSLAHFGEQCTSCPVAFDSDTAGPYRSI